MNIFGVGGTELVIIFIIMLVVAGPKRMVRWAYHIGQYVGKFRQMWSEVVDVVQAEMDASGVDVKIPKEIPTRQNIGEYVSELAKPYTKELEQAAKDLENPIKETLDETNKSVKETLDEADKSLKETLDEKDKSKDKKEKPAQTTTTAADDKANAEVEVEEEAKPEKPEKAAAKKMTSMNVGTWGASKPMKLPTTDSKSDPEPASDNGSFGAWSNPQRPTGSVPDQEA